MLCRDCGSNRGSPLYQVSAASLAVAIPVCLLAAVFGGWILADLGRGFGFFGLALAFLYGTVLAEITLRMTGRKRGLTVEILAGASAFVGLVSGWIIADMAHARASWSYFLVARLGSAWTYVVLGVAIFAVINRIRNI